ncbi:hypothetical protein [Parvularcula oceani]|uniref:hypothetical protein n=1 Tax=Parvularcula oceani TaxID=1247963 RepID=UPI0004E17B39|nr:hypothetical protein [Parvularcula oceani]
MFQAIPALSAALAACAAMTGGAEHARAAQAWTVCLSHADDAPPSRTRMVLEGLPTAPARSVAIEGSFYGAAFETARATRTANSLIFSAVTEDASGAYHHAARLSGEVFIGQTLAVGRDFLMPWTATQGDSPCPE